MFLSLGIFNLSLEKNFKNVADQGSQSVLTVKQTQKIFFEIKGDLNSTLKLISLPAWLNNS